MIICGECGKRFGEEEIKTVSECVGEYWGVPAYQDYGTCPFCGSDCIEEEKYRLMVDGTTEDTFDDKDKALEALKELLKEPEYKGCEIILLDQWDDEVEDE